MDHTSRVGGKSSFWTHVRDSDARAEWPPIRSRSGAARITGREEYRQLMRGERDGRLRRMVAGSRPPAKTS